MYYFDSRNEIFKKPFGAVKEDTEITFTVHANGETNPPSLCIRKDGEDAVIIPMSECYTDNNKCYTTRCTLSRSGLYFYRFVFGDSTGLYNDGHGKGSLQNGGDWFIQTVYSKDFSTPDFYKNGLVYQIFPDRFYESRKIESLSYPDRHYRKDKDGLPFYRWGPRESRPITKDYYGGDLNGIAEKLPYLKSLGVTVIYLNPIFESHSNHRYDTADYMKIDPDLGTEEDFAALCEKAHEHGIRIILDGVFSHTGDDSIYFNKEKRYGDGGAYNDPNSPYREWFDFDSRYKNGYRSWWDFPTMPEVDENNPSYTEFICGENGVIAKWLNLGADGFRLDVADELPDEFIEKIRQRVKACGKDKLLIGEVWEDAVTKFSMGCRRTYLLGKGLDSVMNYPFRNAVIRFIREGDGLRFCEDIFRIYEEYPKEAMDCAWNNLSTHDVPRAITRLTSDNPDGGDREWQAVQKLSKSEFLSGKQKLLCAYALCFALPGVPSLYYGDEIGMEGYKDPFNRAYFKWWDMHMSIAGEIRTMSLFRQYHNQFTGGGLYFAHASHNAVAIVRYNGGGEVMVCVNRGDEAVNFEYKGRKYTVAPMSYFFTDHI